MKGAFTPQSKLRRKELQLNQNLEIDIFLQRILLGFLENWNYEDNHHIDHHTNDNNNKAIHQMKQEDHTFPKMSLPRENDMT